MREVAGILGDVNTGAAAAELLNADTWAVVHHVVYNDLTSRLLGANRTNGWYSNSSAALALNQGVLEFMLGWYLSEDLRGKQAAFSLVDWARACVAVVLCCPLLRDYMREQVAAEPGVRRGLNAWVWFTVWDIASVFGQMALGRADSGRGTTPSSLPSAERDRIAHELLERERKSLRHSDTVRCTDKRTGPRKDTCMFLTALVTQRVLLLSLLRAKKQLHKLSEEASLGNQGVSGWRADGRCGLGDEPQVVWPAACTSAHMEEIRMPALYHWVQKATRVSPLPDRLGPHSLMPSPQHGNPSSQPGTPTARALPTPLPERTPGRSQEEYGRAFGAAHGDWRHGPDITEVLSQGASTPATPLLLPWADPGKSLHTAASVRTRSAFPPSPT
jgi:hypothetical protein